ncbi:hypothetical protein BX600DRAFT_432861 [Xylariales sp. PMI_506]|nr:hypothetical protein BX600DRAFT_432861 [Xylariales sp. PMI_506]
MKFDITILALASLAAGQLGDLPTCAKSCLTEFTSGDNIGGCAAINAKCICAQSTFIDGIACCLAGACDSADQSSAVTYAVSFCAIQGVSVPTAVSCTSTAASTVAASTTASATGTGTTPAATGGSVTATSTGTTSATSTSSASATPNAAHLEAGGSGAAGFLGGLLAALALL